jgi:phytanoyl-CoA dioxygenase PhyH
MQIGSFVRKMRFVMSGGALFTAMAFMGRFQVARKLGRAWIRAFRPAHKDYGSRLSSIFEPVPELEVKSALERDALWAGLRLRPQVLTQLREALEDKPCYGFGQPQYAFRNADKREAEKRFNKTFLQSHYYGLEHIHPAFKQLPDDPVLKKIVRDYFQCEPVWTGTRVWWSYATNASEDERRAFGQAFHYDVDDYLALNVFIYLTDVDMDAGAHVFVRGSHRFKRLRHLLRPVRTRTDEEIEQVYGKGRVESLCGPAGFGFVEDPFCFHKALHPHRSDRLVLQVRFALRDYKAATEQAHSAQLADALRA